MTARSAPTWTILVPTLGERHDLFARLMRSLLPQLDAHEGRVQVVGWWNNGSPSLPKIRQTMVNSAGSDYVSFIDDDDLVSHDYVNAITEALRVRPDYVGFEVQCYSDGHPIAIAQHSLKFRRWRNLPGRFERDISHINPILTSVARRADFTLARRGGAEDRIWADQIRRAKWLRREVFVPRIMYHYLYSTSTDAGQGSRWERHHVIHPAERRAEIEHPYFTWSADA